MRAPCAALCAVLFISSCGLDTFYYLDAPMEAHSCTPTTSDETLRYVSFITAEQTENNGLYASGGADFTFSGTAVYYRIYDSLSSLSSFTSTISALNSSSSYSSAAERLISGGYKPLSLSSGETPSPLVAQTGQNRYVYVRLTPYNAAAEFAPAVRVGTGSIQDSTGGSALFGQAVPCRANGGSFDFGSDSVALPASADGDATLASSSKSDVYYVDLYAFSVGQDTTFTRSYSSVLHAGTIPITTD